MRKFLITAFVAIIAAVAAQAQGNLTKAINAFISHKDVIEGLTLNSEVEEDKDGSGNKCMFYHYMFCLPASKAKLFTPLRTAFMKDAPMAYNVYTKSAGASTYNTSNIAYGQNLEHSIQFGSHRDRNYLVMLVRDSQDTLRRSAYALVWYENTKDGTFNGSITRIYSRDPKKTRSKKTKTYVVKSKKYGDIDLSELNFDNKDLNLDNLEKNLDGESMTSYFTDSMSSGTDFLRRFSDYRALYIQSMENDASLTYRTTLVNRIVKFVKENKKVLNKSEKTVCINGLKDLKERTKDKYLALLLEDAEQSL